MILNKTGVQKHAAFMHNNDVALIHCSTEITLFVEIHWADGNLKGETDLLGFVHIPFLMAMPILILNGLRIFYPDPFLQILQNILHLSSVTSLSVHFLSDTIQ